MLPGLLERSLKRGWRAAVQAASDERVAALDTLLWTYRDESFLPHGTARDGRASSQPIYLTAGDDNPNEAQVRFLVDGAMLADASPYTRVAYVFDGRDQDAVARAREAWQTAKAAGIGRQLLAARGRRTLGAEGLTLSIYGPANRLVTVMHDRYKPQLPTH